MALAFSSWIKKWGGELVSFVGEDENGNPSHLRVTGNALSAIEDWNYTILANATGAQVIKATPGTYGGYFVLSAAGAGTMDVWDNASAASGQRVDRTSITIAAAADRPINPGIRLVNGLVVAVTTTPPTAGAVMILWK